MMTSSSPTRISGAKSTVLPLPLASELDEFKHTDLGMEQHYIGIVSEDP